MSSNKDNGLAQVMQVFISSASNEMAAYREQAIRAIKDARMIHKNYNDPKGAGLSQGAKSIFELNRDTIKQCDIFLGIYGFGGVWRPASHPGLVKLHPELLNDEDKLIMEYEYEWAQEAGLYLFRFMRINETKNVPLTPVDPRMDRFRVHLMTGTVGWLSDPDAFHDELVDALNSVKPKIFLSYSRRDSEAANDIQTKLRNEDLHVWRDQTNIPGSAEWVSVIEAAMDGMEAAVVIVTPNSGPSEWVRRECLGFLKKGKPVIPYITDPSMKSAMPTYLSSIQYIDGTVPQGFAALVKQLRVVLHPHKPV